MCVWASPHFYGVLLASLLVSCAEEGSRNVEDLAIEFTSNVHKTVQIADDADVPDGEASNINSDNKFDNASSLNANIVKVAENSTSSASSDLSDSKGIDISSSKSPPTADSVQPTNLFSSGKMKLAQVGENIVVSADRPTKSGAVAMNPWPAGVRPAGENNRQRQSKVRPTKLAKMKFFRAAKKLKVNWPKLSASDFSDADEETDEGGLLDEQEEEDAEKGKKDEEEKEGKEEKDAEDGRDANEETEKGESEKSEDKKVEENEEDDMKNEEKEETNEEELEPEEDIGEIASRKDENFPPPPGGRPAKPTYLFVGGRPSSSRRRRPSYGAQRPSNGAQRPSNGAQRPSYGAQRPSNGAQRPSNGAQRPSNGAQRPSYGAQRPSYGAQRPSYGGKRPSLGSPPPPPSPAPPPPPGSGNSPPQASPGAPATGGNLADGKGKFNFAGCGQPKARHYGSRIIGGKRTTSAKWPWQVSLRLCGSVCGGSIVNRYWIVTAAHCFSKKYNYKPRIKRCMLIYLDKKGLADADRGRWNRMKMSKIILHSGYSKKTVQNDIALVKVSKALVYNKNTAPVCVPKKTVAAGKRCMSTGYGLLKGRESRGSKASLHQLMEVDLPVVTAAKCKRFWRRVLREDLMLCAGWERGKDTCQGDSGGPFVCREENVWYLHGVVSFGAPNCDKGPGVYAKVPYYIDWLLKNMDKDV